MKTLRLFILTLLLAPFLLNAQAPEFVQDFNTLQLGLGNPELLGKLGNILFFTADDGINGRELWRTDGTEMGTYMVKDITPGPGSTTFYTNGYKNNHPTLNNKLYFSIRNRSYSASSDIWITDGTELGTVEYIVNYHPSTTFYIFKDKLYYHRINANRDWDLYRYSSESGEELVHLLAKDVKIANNYIYYFERSNYSPNNTKLYRFDGATAELIQTYAGFVSPIEATTRADDYYFSLRTSSVSMDLLKYNNATNSFEIIYQTYYNTLKFKWVGLQLYITKPITYSLNELICCPAGDCQNAVSLSASLINISGEVAGKILYETKENSSIKAYASDGTVSGTTMVRSAGGWYDGSLNIELNGYTFLTQLGKIYKTNGTVIGTSEVVSNDSTFKFTGSNVVEMGGNLYFVGFDGIALNELWKSNGLNNGFFRVKDITLATQDGVNEMMKSDNSLYVSSSAPRYYEENYRTMTDENKTVWKQNSVTGFFEPIKSFQATIESYRWSSDNLKLLGTISSKFFYEYYNLISRNSELWMYDELLQTNTLITTFSNAYRVISAFLPENINNHIFFIANLSYNTTYLYTLNLTTFQTNLVKELDSNVNIKDIRRLNANKVILNDFDKSFWVSDGTNEGTFSLMDETGNIYDVAPTFANKIYFHYRVQGMRRLWVTDGTTDGTYQLALDAQSSGTNSPYQFTITNNHLYLQYDSLIDARTYLYESYLVKINGLHQISRYVIPKGRCKIFPTNTKLMFYYGNEFNYFNLTTNEFEQTTSPFVIDRNLESPYYSDIQTVCYYSSEPNMDISVLNLNSLQKKDYKIGTSLSPVPRIFLEHKGILYFFAKDYRGLELWKMRLSCEGAYPDMISVSGTLINNQTIQANRFIVAPPTGLSNIVTNTANITYQAGDFILLNPGFQAQNGAFLKIQISGCQ